MSQPTIVKPILPVYGAAPEFRLTTQFDRFLDSKNLAGSPWIADFIFTSCAGTCPMMTHQLAQLQKKLPKEVTFISFTVDPKRDTPQILSDYGKAYGADSSRWFFLTGDYFEIQRIAQEGFHLSAVEGELNEQIVHSVRLVLVDGTGAIRGYYDGTQPDRVKALQKDALWLVQLQKKKLPLK